MAMFRKPPLLLPKPRRSPPLQPYDSSLTTSGVFRALEATKSRVNAMSVIGAVVTIGGLAGGLYAVAGIARSEAAEKIAPLDAGIKNVSERMDFFKAEFNRHLEEEAEHHRKAEAQAERQDKQQQLMMDALRIPDFKRPPPIDGGSP